MIDSSDISDVFDWCSGHAADKTPQVTTNVVAAWLSHFSDYPKLTREDVFQAVKLHYRNPQDRMVQPADISKIAREVHQDRIDRESESDRRAREDAWDAELARRNRERLAAVIEPIANAKAIPE